MWFDLCSKGDYITFWVREKFPVITLCYVLAVESEMKKAFNCEIRFFINGEELFELEIPRGFSEMVTDHVWLYDLRTHPSIDWHSLDSYLEDDWNQVEISCEKLSEGTNVTVSWCGIHVCKQETNMNDISFTDPYLESDSIAESDEYDTKLMIPTKETNSLEGCENGDEMEAFYASLDAEASFLVPFRDIMAVSELATNNKPSEETKKALKIFEECLTKDFSDLLESKEYNTMKSALDYLSGLSANDGVTVEMRSMIMEVSREFTHCSCDYSNASMKMEITKSSMMKADELEDGIEANKKHFREMVFLENDLHSQLVYLEERKKELEEQINVIKANISASESAKKKATNRKREIFEEGKMLKAQRDELREQGSCLRDEWELAKRIQEHIRAEWSKLGEKLKKENFKGVY